MADIHVNSIVHEDKTYLQNEIQKILRHKMIHSVYQPIVSLKNGDILGYEALTRGPHNHPFHSPLPLFTYADETGQLYPLDRLAREKAIQGAFFASGEELLFINISAAILHDPQFVPGMA